MPLARRTRHLSRLVVAAVAAVALAGLSPPAAPRSELPVLRLAPSLDRIARDAPPGPDEPLTIHAARGECESFQAVATSGPAVARASLALSDFRGPASALIPASATRLYREHYVHVARSSPDPGDSNRPRGPGWYADALIPLDAEPTAAIAAGESQPYWIDVCVPRDAPPGGYEANLSLELDGATLGRAVRLHVWDFELPLRPALASAFLTAKPSRAINRLLLEHRLMPRDMPRTDQPAAIERHGLSITNIGLWSAATNASCAMRPAPALAVVRRASAAQDPRLARYNYTADEIDSCPGQIDTMKAWARVLHQAGIDNLVTMKPRPELFDDGSGTGRSAVDIWVLLPKMYEAAGPRVAEALAKGDRVWSYNALVQDGHSPKWQIDFAPIDFRIQPGFMSHSLGLTGLLYWQVDRWTSRPWDDVETYANANGVFPGEGMLVYPGQPKGIPGAAPSMRLKWLRDGVDDYDYLALLDRLGCAGEARRLASAVAASWRRWTHDPAVLEARRLRAGDLIERVSKGGACSG